MNIDIRDFFFLIKIFIFVPIVYSAVETFYNYQLHFLVVFVPSTFVYILLWLQYFGKIKLGIPMTNTKVKKNER